jgi:hypothetical protein
LNIDLEGALCDAEAARLLPWYITGRLSQADAERVGQHIEHCAVCREDFADQRALRTRVKADTSVEIAPQAGLAATLARIDELGREMGPAHEQHREAAVAPAAAAIIPIDRAARRGAQPLRRQQRVTQWLAAAAVVQAIGLAMVGRALLQAPGNTPADKPVAGYETLSSPEAPAPVGQIRAVFARSMSVDALHGLLRGQHLTIVGGPTEAGVFTLGFEAGAVRPAAALQALRADPQVQFAEPTSAAGSARP